METVINNTWRYEHLDDGAYRIFLPNGKKIRRKFKTEEDLMEYIFQCVQEDENKKHGYNKSKTAKEN